MFSTGDLRVEGFDFHSSIKAHAWKTDLYWAYALHRRSWGESERETLSKWHDRKLKMQCPAAGFTLRSPLGQQLRQERAHADAEAFPPACTLRAPEMLFFRPLSLVLTPSYRHCGISEKPISRKQRKMPRCRTRGTRGSGGSPLRKASAASTWRLTKFRYIFTSCHIFLR